MNTKNFLKTGTSIFVSGIGRKGIVYRLYCKQSSNPKLIEKIGHLTGLIKSDTLDEVDAETIEVMKRILYKEKKAFVQLMHPFAITGPCGERKRYQTYIRYEETSDGSSVRKKIVKPSEEDLIDYLYLLYSNQLVEETGQEKKSSVPSLIDLYPEWLEYKRRHGAAETYIKRINSDWKTYYLTDDLFSRPISELKTFDLDEWAHRIIKENAMTAKKYTNATVIAREALNFAVDKELLEVNPFLKVKVHGRQMFVRDRKKEAKTQVYTPDETAAIVKEAWKDFQDEGRKKYLLTPLAVIFQFQTGVRVGELCALRYEDIKGDLIHIQRMTRGDHLEIVNHTKTEMGDRWIFLTPEAKEVIAVAAEFQKENGYVQDSYIFTTNGQPLLYRNVNAAYRRYCKRLGILYRSSHKVRKTCISAMLSSDMNADTVRQIAGNAQLSTTYNCYYYDRALDQEKMDQMSRALSTKNGSVN